MNRRTFVVSTAVISIGAFALGAAFYGNSVAEPPLPKPVVENTLVRMHSPVMGPAAAPVTIVEFFDPSCEACRAFYPIVKQMMAQTGNDVRLVLRYTPLHKGSDEAIRILEAARKQDRFEPVLEALLANQPEWAVHGAPDIEKAWQIAAGGGLDLTKARLDAVSPVVDDVLAQDLSDVKANDIRQTPTFYVNGKLLTEFSPQGLYNLVTSELKAVRPGS